MTKVNLFINVYLVIFLVNFFHIVNSDGIFEISLVPKCKGKLPCNTYFKICLRHYEKTVNFDGGCSFGEVTIAPNEYEKIHQIKLNFSWTRDFSLILEGYTSQGSERYATKKRVLRHSFQEALEVASNWKEEIIRSNHSTITTKIRVLCDLNFYGKDCSQKCVPRDDKYGHYECTDKGKKCLPGWQGEYCDLAICAEGCRNGTCKIPGTCECSDGYQGVLCDKCKVFPGCQHGSCKKPWECNCDDGWGGSFCDRDLNYCTNHRPCANGLCLNTGERSYTCECVIGYTGVNCDIPVSDCSTSPCLNGGSCSQVSPTSNYTCECPLGFTGNNCEKRISAECDWKPCENGGTCSNGPSGYLCFCPPGYKGPNCETRATSCNQTPCLNGATCQSSSSSTYTCICRAGFNGTHCETNINDCASDVDLCFNGGTCIDGDNSYTCSCLAGFTGPSCQTNVDDCLSNPCLNHGKCTDLVNGYSCKCAAGFSGIDCSQSSLDTPSPLTSSTQSLLSSSLSSSSLSSLSSSSSSLSLPSSCRPNQCLNGGECKIFPLTTTSRSHVASSSSSSSSTTTVTTTTTNFAKCKCRPGFSGPFCEIVSSDIISGGSSHHPFPVPVPILIRSEKSLSEEGNPESSSFEAYLSKSQTAMISVILCIVPFVLLCILSVKLSKRRIRAQERQRYENEEAIRQNEENSSKKCLQNDSCLIYNDLNRDSMRTMNGLSHSHLHHSSLSSSSTPLPPPQPPSSQCNLIASPSCNKLTNNNDDYIVNELTLDPNLTIYGLTPPPTLPPLTLSTDPSGVTTASTSSSVSCHPSPVYSKYATLTSHHHHHHPLHHHHGGSVVDLHYLHHHLVT